MKGKLCQLLFAAFITKVCCEANKETQNQLVAEHAVFKGGSKNWKKYLQAYLANRIMKHLFGRSLNFWNKHKKTILSNIVRKREQCETIEMLQDLSTGSKVFLHHTEKIVFTKKCFPERYFQFESRYQTASRRRTGTTIILTHQEQIKAPTSLTFEMHYPNGRMKEKDYYRKCQSPESLLTWKISLAKTLALKLMIKVINIATVGPKEVCIPDAYFGAVKLQEKFVFCGFTPSFSLYPFSQKLNLEIMCNVKFNCYANYHIDLLITMVDSGKIDSHVLPTVDSISLNNQSKAGHFELYLKEQFVLKNSSSVCSFLIRVKKTWSVVINVSTVNSPVVIYEGPAVLVSQQLHHLNNVYQTKSFQAKMVSSSSWGKVIQNISFKSQNRSLSKTIIVNEKETVKFNFHQKTSLFNPLVVHVRSLYGLKIEVEVTSLLFTGVSSHACTGGGFSILEKNGVVELISICKSQFKGTNFTRNIFSSTSELYCDLLVQATQSS